jgi:hypothetical protein
MGRPLGLTPAVVCDVWPKLRLDTYGLEIGEPRNTRNTRKSQSFRVVRGCKRIPWAVIWVSPRHWTESVFVRSWGHETFTLTASCSKADLRSRRLHGTVPWRADWVEPALCTRASRWREGRCVRANRTNRTNGTDGKKGTGSSPTKPQPEIKVDQAESNQIKPVGRFTIQ